MKLYQIIDCLGFGALGMERDQKLENVACWIKNLEADNVAIKEALNNGVELEHAKLIENQSLSVK